MGRAATGALGQAAEERACDYLKSQGAKIIQRNFRRRGGEIDLIVLSDECLVFVEVRFRTSKTFATAALSVDYRKQQKLIRTAAQFVASHPRYAQKVMRFDVIAIHASDVHPIEHIRDAFRPNHSNF